MTDGRCGPVQGCAQPAPAPQRHWTPHVHEAPQVHIGPQAWAVCAAACWQPQVQPVPGQVLQRQAEGWAGFMVVSFGLNRRRDVFDGRTFGRVAAHEQADETNGHPACGNGVADRPSGRVAGAV